MTQSSIDDQLTQSQLRGQRIRQIRTELGLTAKEFGKKLGVGDTAIANYEKGGRRPKPEIMEAIADYGNCDLKWLSGTSDVRNPADYQSVYDSGYKEGILKKSSLFREVPVYNPISCGTGAWIQDSPDEYIGVPSCMTSQSAIYFGNPAEGDSMEPGIHAGDYLIFEKMEEVESGQIGSFSLNGEYFCKRLKKYRDGSCWLISDNPDYAPIPIHPDDEFRTLGKYRLKLSKEQ